MNKKLSTKSRVYRILSAFLGSIVLLAWFPYTVNWGVLELLDPQPGSSLGAYVYIISVIDFVLVGAYLGVVLKKNPSKDQMILFLALVGVFVVFCLAGGWEIYF